MNEDLRNWFREKWVRMDTKGNIKGDCAREEGEGKPKCLPLAKASSMSKEKRAAAARRKRREDPVANRPGKGGKPVNVATEEVSTSELIKKSHEKRGSPGTLKAKIKGPITLEKVRQLKNRPNATTLDKKQANFYINMHTEEYLEEKNAPTNPSLWSKAKSLARQKFDVYPSAYANGWAAKWYKSKGGGWKSLEEGAQMKPSKTAQEKFKSGLKKAGYDPDAGAKRLLDLIAKQKKEREEFESKYKSAYEGKEMKSLKQIVEGTVISSDYKISKSGRKYRAHRVKMGRDTDVKEDVEQVDEIALKPEHKASIKRLRPSGSHSKTSFKLDSGKTYYATREGDDVHLVTHETGAGTSKKTTMKYSQFDEEMGKGPMSEDTLDEARGRPAGAATLAKRAAAAAKPREDDDEGEHYDADSGVEADQHIHVQLKKASDSDQKPFEVSFKNGKKHTVSQKVAKDILGATERLKPEHRKNVHDEIHQSYDNLMSVHRLIAGR